MTTRVTRLPLTYKEKWVRRVIYRILRFFGIRQKTKVVFTMTMGAVRFDDEAEVQVIVDNTKQKYFWIQTHNKEGKLCQKK